MAFNKANSGWWGLPLAVVSLVAIATAFTLFLVSTGFPIFAPEPKEKVVPVPAAEIVSQWEVSPAMAKLTEALEAPPEGWQGAGTLMTAPQTPYPFSCVTEGINPVLSVSKNFNAAGTSIQVLTTAYSAGLGAQGMKAKFDKARACAGNDASYFLGSLQGIGAESYQATVSKAGLNTRTVIWRYGDIVVYLIADINNMSTYGLAKAFNDNMVAKLAGTCVAQDYETDAPNRNPFSELEYKGFFADKTVEIKKVDAPKIPAGVSYKETPLPAPEVAVQDITVPVASSAYPVWPLLPAAKEKPVAPKSPSTEPPSKQVFRIMAEDKVGPGCGWAFTGSTSPAFDAKKADSFNTEEETKTTSALNASAKQWQTDVLKYWDEYGTFQTNVAAWDIYATQVEAVRAAWQKIDTDWANYKEAKAFYDSQVRARDAFIARQKASQEQYDSLLKQCEAQDKADEVKAEEERKKAEQEKNNPTPSPSPSPTATPSPTPTQEAPRVECPAEKPAILDQKAPEVDASAPTPPADPRPVAERK